MRRKRTVQRVRSGSAKNQPGNHDNEAHPTRIEALECPVDARTVSSSTRNKPASAVRVTAGGGKSYVAQYSFAGEKRRIPLGSCSAVSLAAAREAVRTIMGDVAKGRDPAAERKEAARQAKEKAEQDKLTLAALVDKWEEGRLAGRRPGYRAEATRALRFAFAGQLKAPAAALDARTARRIVNEIADAGKAATARLTTAYGRACFVWAIDRGLVADNPFRAIKAEGVPSRDRVLTDQELREIWKAAEGPSAYGLIIRMLILTGQRRDEVAGMTTEELFGDLSAWTIPAARAKNGVAHIVPLPEQARAIIEASPRRSDASPNLVFSARGGQFAGWSKAKALLDQKSGVADWRAARLSPNARNRPAEARRPPRSDRSGSQPRVGNPGWHYRGLSETPLGRREARGARRMGRACCSDRRWPRSARERDADPGPRRCGIGLSCSRFRKSCGCLRRAGLP